MLHDAFKGCLWFETFWYQTCGPPSTPNKLASLTSGSHGQMQVSLKILKATPCHFSSTWSVTWIFVVGAGRKAIQLVFPDVKVYSFFFNRNLVTKLDKIYCNESFEVITFQWCMLQIHPIPWTPKTHGKMKVSNLQYMGYNCRFPWIWILSKVQLDQPLSNDTVSRIEP